MSRFSHHMEWLSLVEVSGPFLSVSVLEKVFPQGLDAVETHMRRRARSAYNEWCDAVEEDDAQLPELHRAWIELVLTEILEFDDSVLLPVNDNVEYTYKSPDGNGQFTPDYLLSSDTTEKPMLLVSILPQGTDLEKVRVGDGWPASVFERMTLLCRSIGVRLGLVTNGERWMLVNAPVGSPSSHISWYARLWFQEPLTLKAFQSLLEIRRWFRPEEETLPALLEESLQHHEEVTDTLGEQVKRAVEVLVQCLDKADQDRNRELLHDVPAVELYEAGLTVMMRLVFVLCAEERGLLLLDDPTYDQYYAITTLRGQLAEEADRHGPEVLERRHDAWARLLSVFRILYGGVEHEMMRMPALGGSLFDPDRFPFLEGRAKETNWRETPAQPLPIDNRTVLLLLDALQVLEQRGGALLLSYKALDVEQIGHVYEGLLEYTVKRIPKDTLGLIGSQKAKNPNLPLAELESAFLDGEKTLVKLIQETTLRSLPAIKKSLEKEVDENSFGKVLAICGGDMDLANRIKPFTRLLRTDAWGDFIVYRADSFAVALGGDRRETGTHYTPKSLTESIVEKTLEPLVYVGPAEGKPREEWQLKSSSELLELKICDPAMGSGAFLVQVCRWLSERLVEAWGNEEKRGKFITVDGFSLDEAGSAEPMPDSLDERLLIARRLVAEKCLYGVDLNPLAVELAKLSIWLITLAKGRPFGFLDHNLRSGDSLLGLHKLEQLTKFTLHPEKKKTASLFASNIETAVKDALALRKKLRETPIRDIQDVQYMVRLDRQARQKLENIEHIADAMIGEVLASGGNQRTMNTAMDNLSTWAAAYIAGDNETGGKIIAEARKSLSIDLPAGKPPRKPFHWALEFPEVFERGGFDGIVGNPPFIFGKNVSANLGTTYNSFLINQTPNSSKNVDICAHFLFRDFSLLSRHGDLGVLSTSSIAEGETRLAGLENLIQSGGTIFSASSKKKWPGRANVFICQLHVSRSNWTAEVFLNQEKVERITPFLTASSNSSLDWQPQELMENIGTAFYGVIPNGGGFFVNAEDASKILKNNPSYNDCFLPFLTGRDLNGNCDFNASRYAINFWDWPLEKANQYKLLFDHVVDHVKTYRKTLERKKPKLFKNWWLYEANAKGLYEAIGFAHHYIKSKKNNSCLDRVLVIARVSSTNAFVFVPAKTVFDSALIAFAIQDYGKFGVLQSNIHFAYAWQHGGKMKTDLRYSPKMCFLTFPFPKGNIDLIESTAKEFYEMRSSYLHKEQIGLTEFNRSFHAPDINSAALDKIRKSYMKLDSEVLKAYGWQDVDIEYGFHAVDYLPQRKNIRFTISEGARREVLQRLLKLNHERYEEEVKKGLHDKKKKPANPQKKKKSVAQKNGQMTLFGE